MEGIAALLGSENGSRYRGVSQLQSHQSRYSVQLRPYPETVLGHLLRFAPICSDLFSEQIRKRLSADPFCKSSNKTKAQEFRENGEFSGRAFQIQEILTNSCLPVEGAALTKDTTTFLLTIGSCLLTVELVCLQLELFCLQFRLVCLQWENVC